MTNFFMPKSAQKSSPPQPNGKHKPNGTNGAHHDTDADIEATAQRLGRLPSVEYDRVREAEAKALGCRVKTLDLLVRDARGDKDVADGLQGRPLNLPTPEPWPDPVDGAALLFDLSEFFTRHAFLPERASVALALWAVHTYAFEAFRHTPRLHVRAIAKNSGKSTVLDLLEMVVCRPLPTAHATSSVLFRTIEMAKPTLLIDEADTFLAEAEEVRGIINAGHKHGGQVLRAVGDDHMPRTFRVFAPIAIAGIGRLPGTIEDRSIAIPMKRAMRSELPAAFTAQTTAEGARLSRCAVRWTLDHVAEMDGADPDMGGMYNRLADNWRALFVIADLAGDAWPAIARKAAEVLAVVDDDTESMGVKLLGDIKRVFEEKDDERRFVHQGVKTFLDDRGREHFGITSADLATVLGAMEGRPWAEFGRTGKPMTINRLAMLLKPFAVFPRKIGGKEDRVNGYLLPHFFEAFGRHLPPL
jgi:hypothetical protein